MGLRGTPAVVARSQRRRSNLVEGHEIATHLSGARNDNKVGARNDKNPGGDKPRPYKRIKLSENREKFGKNLDNVGGRDI